MSELLARTLIRALPLFVQRWRDEGRDRGIPEPFRPAEQESPWSLLVDAVRSGEYRPAASAIRRDYAQVDDPYAALRAQTALLAECLRTAYDGDPRDLPTLLREMDAVWDILMHAETDAAANPRPIPPLVDALDRAAGIVPFVGSNRYLRLLLSSDNHNSVEQSAVCEIATRNPITNAEAAT